MSKMKWFESVEAGVVIVSLANGDLLLESLREVAHAANIHTGVLMTGLGSLSAGHIHYVVSNDMPPRDEFVKLPGPLEIVGFSGIIAAYQPHVHIALMDQNGKFFGGHLEEGCAILTLSEISIRRLPDLKLTRRAREGGTITLLDLE